MIIAVNKKRASAKKLTISCRVTLRLTAQIVSALIEGHPCWSPGLRPLVASTDNPPYDTG
jgi:hypothetical protein